MLTRRGRTRLWGEGLSEGILGRSGDGLTHSYGLEVDIPCGDLGGDASYRTRSHRGGGEGGHTSKEVPNMLSFTKDILLAEGDSKGRRGEKRRGQLGETMG